MISVSRLISRSFLQRSALLRATSANNQRFFASNSDSDDASKTKTSISNLLSSLRQTGRKRSPAKSTKREDDSILEYKSTIKEISSLESHQSGNVSMKQDTSDAHREEVKQQISPEMNDQLKSILSKLKVDTAKSQLSKDIVGAVRSWGRMSPRSRQEIEHDFIMQSKPEPARIPKMISLTSGEKLDLFDDVFDGKTSSKEASPSLKLLEGEDIELLEKQKSLDQRNDFLTMIEMSEKQWKFPVDNEVCKVDEAGVGFEEHVFLGHLLDSFPKKGPVRRFMELVVNGLEQNPYMSVEQKKKQVLWFEEYFNNIPEEDLSF